MLRAIKSRRMGQLANVARVGGSEVRNIQGIHTFIRKTQKRRDEQGIDVRLVLLNLMLKRQVLWCGLASAGSQQVPVAGSSELGNRFKRLAIY
jgi:hypothetical protein